MSCFRQLHRSVALKNLSLRSTGFSLLELMVAVAVLMIGLTIVVPGMGQIIQSNKLAGTSSELQLALTYARMEAIRQNRGILFCHTDNGSSCSVVPEEGWQGFLIRAAGSSFGAETGAILRSHVLPAGPLRISSGAQLTGSKDAILFTSTGQLQNFTTAQPLGDWLQLCITQSGMKNNIRRIQFKSSGRIAVVTLDGGGECS